MGVPIYHGWYDRAKTGMHDRTGDKVVQDYGLSREAVISPQELLDEEWLTACSVFLGSARELRGEEITKIELSGVRK
jgi:hypothetical protein